jgi:hypothetical protein
MVQYSPYPIGWKISRRRPTGAAADMAIDRQFIGFGLPSFTVRVDADKLRQFAAAVGGRAGDMSADRPPPTYLKVIEGEGSSSRQILAALGVDLTRVLHAEQEFEYHAPYRGGDALTVERTVADIYERKGGALEFIVVDSVIRHASGILVGRTRQVLSVRHPSATALA